MDKKGLKKAKKALKTRDVDSLNKLLEDEGFRDFDMDSDVKLVWARHAQEREKEGLEVVSRGMFVPTYYKDKTDYYTPYEKGFLKTKDNWFAGYGIIEEINIKNRITLDVPHHFFFVDNLFQQEYVSKLISIKGLLSPGNPAAGHRRNSNFITPIVATAFGMHVVQDIALAYLQMRGIELPQDISKSEGFVMGRLFGNVIASNILFAYLSRPKTEGTNARSSLLWSEFGYRGLKRYNKLNRMLRTEC